MTKFVIPDSMKLASVWVVWGFISIGVLGWTLFVVLCHFGVEDTAAAWVQAVGSVGAICAAISIANSQREVELKRLREQCREKEEGMATRLWSAVHGVCMCLDELSRQTPTLKSLPSNISFQYQSMLMRFTQNFDDDLNPDRIDIVGKVRIDLSSVVRMLSDPDFDIARLRMKLPTFAQNMRAHRDDARRHLDQLLQADASVQG